MGGITGGPQALGHEMAGVVEWVGGEVGDIAIGNRVIVHPAGHDGSRLGSGAAEGGLTPLLLVRDVASGRRLFPVPNGMPLRVAALTEPLADKVAVFGCGPVGLMAIATLVDRGIDDVVAVDLSAQRRDLAVGLGAAHAFDPTEVNVWKELKRVHGTVPFMYGPTAATDAFIEASGSDRVLQDILRHGRFGGRMSVVALHYEPVSTNYVDILMKQFTIRGSFEYPPRFEDAIELLERADLSHLITHTVQLDEYAAGLDLLEGSKDCGKVMVLIGEDV
jgi:threonine dehydrogenase-like Zn-dependent dehydrogenase